MKRIFISTSSFGSFDLKPLELLKAHDINFELNSLKKTLTEEEVIGFTKEKDGLIAGVEPLTERVFKECKKLKVISRVGVGLDNVDIAAAGKKGIKVFNTPNGPTEAVAELTLGLIINLLRPIINSDVKIRKGIWQKEMGSLLYEKNVGIVGFGKIGKKVAEILKVFNCKIFVYDPFVTPTDNRFTFVKNLEELLNNSDIVSLHLPYSKEKHHMINKKMLELMRPNAILINTSRGGLVDEDALYEHLMKKKIAGAAFDTFEMEPYTGKLCQLNNVILTPHIGSYAKESRIQMEMDAVKNLIMGFGLSV